MFVISTLHMLVDNVWAQIPLEIKCPTPMFGNRFNGRMRIKHLIQVHIQMSALRAPFGYLCYWTQEAGYLYKIPFDHELWDRIKDGILNWRRAVERNAAQAPQTIQDKELYKQVWERCEQVYHNVLANGDYSTLPSCVARPGK